MDLRMTRYITCCEHNPCPNRPRWWLSRFHTRPWRCPQCGTWWVSTWHQACDQGFWGWKKVTKAADDGSFV